MSTGRPDPYATAGFAREPVWLRGCRDRLGPVWDPAVYETPFQWRSQLQAVLTTVSRSE